MFGNITHMLSGASARPVAPKDVPPPTPVNFPRCYPQDHPQDRGREPDPDRPSKPIISVLQSIVRPTELTVSHLEALGTHVTTDCPLETLIPDPTFIPDFASWRALSPDGAHATNESTRKRLNNGNLSPGCQTYLERQREFSIPNEAAYRAVRRIPAPKGQSQARLGNSFEFFRYLELFSTYWDDTSKPPTPKLKPSESTTAVNDGAENQPTPEDAKKPEANPDDPDPVIFYRTGTGHQMPAEYRQNMLTAFVKLVTYDFGCNVSAPRVEPRLFLTSGSPSPRSSYFSSGCTFVFRTPTTRESARAGIVEGPIAAVSARHTTSFPPLRRAPAAPNSASATNSSSSQPPTPTTPSTADRDSTLDLAREVVAALITAQHRAREGCAEKRIGEGAWWTTKPRWGGGSGGPIGREVEMQSGADQTVGDKDEPPPPSQYSNPDLVEVIRNTPTVSPVENQRPVASAAIEVALARRPGSSRPAPGSYGPFSSSGGNNGSKTTKRLKKSGNLPMYDSYRMVRPPAAVWDKKTKYLSLGRKKGADYDDVFVISALFHHISVVRVRVPDRLLAVLAGKEDGIVGAGQPKSWGLLEVKRSPWYDFFKVEERVKAMETLWAMMAWLMREEEKSDGVGQEGKTKAIGGDVEMAGT
ncbi:hypothetical protein B0T19DRAFT_279186 [Cercophora scortea]|uniref:Uncharacterized protein n=1 Tax=Cercophora scortea TaxID=314031 RepID=A0AAE0I7S0_9PEZI|nr:hypothetical protein B0T19DRAFT_279186 [Cercophora scortea]